MPQTKGIKLKGVSKFKNKLHKLGKKYPKRIAPALYAGGLMLQRLSQQMVPVHQSPLKNSAYTRAVGSGRYAQVRVGYQVSYALFVHEAVGMKLKGQKRRGKNAKGRYWDPQGRGQAKFLETPLRVSHAAIMQVIVSRLKD